LVNNAGIMASTEIEFGSMELFSSQMDINCMGAIRVTKVFLPLLRRCSLLYQNAPGVQQVGISNHRKPDTNARIINVCSIAGRYAIPGINSYCVSKAALIAFSDGLRREMIKWGIDVITIEPHLFKTNLVNSNIHHGALDRAWTESSDDVKHSYGTDYLEGYKQFLDKMLFSARANVHDVVNTMFIAVTDQLPSSTYRVLQHDLERVRLAIYEFLPERLLDWMAYIAMRFSIGLPAAYSDSKKQ